jgi:hypothetical protein
LLQNYKSISEQKDKSFHLLPYNFDSSLESPMDFLDKILKLKRFKENQLEIYFNGEENYRICNKLFC